MGADRAARRRRQHEPPRAAGQSSVPSSPIAERLAPFAPFAGPAAIAVLACVMVAWTWRTWPDVLVDFGRELYLAWRLADGATLYVDVAHFSGPLSPYLNAFWFRLFGPSLLSLALPNLLLAALLTALLYRFFVPLSSRFAATAACLAFVVFFACAQFTLFGNYNWACPYSHELTHGVLLVVVALSCLDRYHATGQVRWMAGLGVAMGLVVLTKAEVLLAGGGALAVGVGLTLVVERPSPARAARLLAVAAGAAVVPLLITGVYFATAMPAADVLRWPLGHWQAAARPEFRATNFYRRGMGMDDFAGNVSAFVTVAAAYATVLGGALGAAFAARRVPATWRPAVTAGLFAGTVLLLDRVVTPDTWIREALRPLPAVAALVAATFASEAVRRRAEPGRGLRAARTAAFATLALVLLAKMVLNVRIFHYGFVLAMPATLVLILAMVDWVPAAIGRLGGVPAVARGVTCGVLVAAVAPHVELMADWLRGKVHRVGSGGDAFYADGRATAVNALLEQVGAQVAPGETLVVLPEGVMVNYLARRVNPTPYYIFDSTSFALWDQARMVHALEDAAPDYVALVDRGEEGFARWGQREHFGAPVYAWATSHYRPVWERGVPFSGRRGVSVRLLRRIR